MVKIPFTPEMVSESKKLADSMGAIRNSILEGGGNRAGFLAELALCAYFGAKRVDKANHDILFLNKRIEIKTKRRTVDPTPYYEGSVAITSEHQISDYYAFLSLTFGKKSGKNYSRLNSIWLCGFISYEDFIKNCVFYEKGEIDKSNGFVVLTDMRNIKYRELIKPEEFKTTI